MVRAEVREPFQVRAHVAYEVHGAAQLDEEEEPRDRSRHMVIFQELSVGASDLLQHRASLRHVHALEDFEHSDLLHLIVERLRDKRGLVRDLVAQLLVRGASNELQQAQNSHRCVGMALHRCGQRLLLDVGYAEDRAELARHRVLYVEFPRIHQVGERSRFGRERVTERERVFVRESM